MPLLRIRNLRLGFGGPALLDGVDLSIEAGERICLVGRNGSGKSTLLKILTGVISPSRGRVAVNGRVAALLELGAGFQPEFSGIDNVRMKGALLGMTRRQLDARMDDILAFADIGDYVYEPVKHYSSGMVVRLGFAVVAASDPELLTKFGILDARYLPGPEGEAPLRDDITPVNTYPELLRRYFDADIPNQPDVILGATPARPYDFVDLTERFEELAAADLE